MSSFSSPSLSFLLLLLLPALGLAQLLLPSTHSPLPLAGATRKPCACPPGKTPQALPAERPKAHHPAGGGPSEGNAKEGMDDELLDALKEVGQVGQRLAPLKAGKKGNKGKGKKRKGAGRTRRPRPKRAIDGQQQQQSVLDPALAAPEGAKCNSERLRELIKKAHGRDSAALKRNIQALAERSLAARFNVVCARGDFSYISNTEEFCQERVHGNTCYVFRQLGRHLPFPEPPQLDQFERSLAARRGKKWRKRKKARR